MSTQDLAQQVADLTTATTQLTQEVVGQKARLTAAADTATSKASDASGSASAASASATAANAAAAAAETSKNQAAEISGLDTVEQAIDLTLSKTLGLMTETEAMAQADAYEQVFAASGMVHMGKDTGNGREVNDGLYVHSDPAYAHQVYLGRERVGAGTSKTDFAVSYIAGAVTNILMRNGDTRSTYELSAFSLPPAEAGTRIYDSTGNARGSGKATLDFRYDVDPKYGDVPTGTEAEVLREAVSRAFEGEVKNGDFRNGKTDWSSDRGGVITVVDGIATVTGNAGFTVARMDYSYDKFKAGKSYIISGLYHEGVGDLRISINKSGSYTLLVGSQSSADKPRKFESIITATADSTVSSYIYTVAAATLSISDISIHEITEEVVTHPVDLLTWESYDEELTGRTEVFECIQSLSNTFGTTDVPTVLSTRPNSYFDQYEGQSGDPDAQNTKYRCVVWDDLTDEQKRKVAAYMGNKLYIGENGYLVNRRLRARTFRGTGNGDWVQFDSSQRQVLRPTSGLRVKPQGKRDVAPPLGGYSPDNYMAAQYHREVGKTYSKGTFAPEADNQTGVAYKARCFLYVVASVPRANQGAYHPNLNPWGCAGFEGTNASCTDWSSSLTPEINTQAHCFTKKSTTYYQSGSLARPDLVRRPDGIFYDGITAGGLNGVIDWRLSAFEGDSPEEAAKVQAKVENGSYRGLEKLVWTSFNQIIPTLTFTGSWIADAANSRVFRSCDFSGTTVKYTPKHAVAIHDGTATASYTVSGNNSETQIRSDGTVLFYGVPDPVALAASLNAMGSSGLNVLMSLETNLSVSGEFNTSMVIGDPANILQTDVLKDGWLGTWCPVIPDGTKRLFPYSRKALKSGEGRFTTNNGTSWKNLTSKPMPVVENGYTWGEPANMVLTINYKAFAKQTKPSTNKPVYSAKAGLMGVFGTNTSLKSYGVLFGESLIGKVLTHRYGLSTTESVTSVMLNHDSDNLVDIECEVSSIPNSWRNFAAEGSNTAVKVLPYQISDNGQCSIGYQANELTYETPSVETKPDSYSAWQVNKLYKVTGLDTGTVVLRNKANYPYTLTNCYVSNGKLYNSLNVQLSSWEVWDGSGWGDNSKIKITASGSDTFVDLNGNTNLSVVHELAIPHGWTKNRARAGEQVAGVDL